MHQLREPLFLKPISTQYNANAYIVMDKLYWQRLSLDVPSINAGSCKLQVPCTLFLPNRSIYFL